MSVTYKLVPSEVEGGEAQIVKSGHEQTFLMSEMRTNVAKIEKFLVEAKAQLTLEEAKMTNVAMYHPFVTDLDPAQLAAAAIYGQAKETRDAVSKKIEEVEEMMAKDMEIYAEIERQTGVKLKEAEVEQNKQESIEAQA